ncbi:MAG: hypothetical protein QM764_17735 [Chitinophagaceae bacterium]
MTSAQAFNAGEQTQYFRMMRITRDDGGDVVASFVEPAGFERLRGRDDELESSRRRGRADGNRAERVRHRVEAAKGASLADKINWGPGFRRDDGMAKRAMSPLRERRTQ